MTQPRRTSAHRAAEAREKARRRAEVDHEYVAVCGLVMMGGYIAPGETFDATENEVDHALRFGLAKRREKE